MNYKAEKDKCRTDSIFISNGLENWPDGEGGLIDVDKCKLSGSRCDAFHCPKRDVPTESQFDALEAVGLTEAYEAEIENG